MTASEITKLVMNKQASDGIVQASRPDKLTRYLAIRPTRNLSPDEQEEVESATSKPWPRIFRSGGDPISADLSSPLVSATAQAALAGVPLAGAGILLQKTLPESSIGKYVALGAVPLAAAVGLAAWFKKRAHNRNLVDYIQRMPPGSTRRDLENNPEWQIENDTEKLLNTAKMNAATRGTFKVHSFERPKLGIQENLDVDN